MENSSNFPGWGGELLYQFWNFKDMSSGAFNNFLWSTIFIGKWFMICMRLGTEKKESLQYKYHASSLTRFW